ncbi:DUF523 and DUF1722 domain-containing protein [bacterium]|nr:DUF523 and DUF1722 domain-containing protein [bacterium]
MVINVGISACLLGEKVRYDGGHKVDHYLKETWGQYVSWYPVCPEVECGLPVPREPMQLIRSPEGIRLKTRKSGRDHTKRMGKWMEEKLVKLEKEPLCGFVFKTKSPSSGMRGVRVVEGDKIYNNGIGIFAQAFMLLFPHLPIEDNARLQDPAVRENFMTRVFVYHRWLDYIVNDRSVKGLMAFHCRHRLLLMAHSPDLVPRLGRRMSALTGKNGEAGAHLSAGRNQLNQAVFMDYLGLLMQGLSMRTTIKKNTNVLYHILRCFEKKFSMDEKNAAVEVIENYYRGAISLVVPVTLLQHHLRRYPNNNLTGQHYLHPQPLELMLRNHV